jgi:Skp family chaperone for outer membrane proteins
MHQKLLLAALTVLLLVMAVQNLSQGTPAAEQAASNVDPVYPVAMLDLTKVFKNHERFTERAEKMRAEVTAAEHELKGKREAYTSLTRELESLKRGTDEHRRIEAELKKTAATLHAEVQRQKDAFLRQEAAIYVETYDEVQAAVGEYAAEHGIKLVLRFNGDPFDRNKPDEVAKELNRSVIYHAGIDITTDVLEMVNGR